MKFKKIVAFFAHPDDETLAMGGSLNKLKSEGSEIFIVIPCTGINARKNKQNKNTVKKNLLTLKKDCKKALNYLGISSRNIYFVKFSDNEIDNHSLLSLTQWFENILEKIKPDTIFTHHKFCTNIDHQYCHEAAVLATRPMQNFNINLISAEVPSSTGYVKPTQWEPNFFIELSKNDIKKKMNAMEMYSTERRKYPHPRSPEVLEAYAKVRGSESGYLFAESFMIQKLYNK